MTRKALDLGLPDPVVKCQFAMVIDLLRPAIIWQRQTMSLLLNVQHVFNQALFKRLLRHKLKRHYLHL